MTVSLYLQQSSIKTVKRWTSPEVNLTMRRTTISESGVRLMEILTEEHYRIAEKNGISRRNVYNRVYELIDPWPIEKAITVPVRKKEGKYIEWSRIAKKNGIYNQLFHARRKRGWDLERAATEPPQYTWKKEG